MNTIKLRVRETMILESVLGQALDTNFGVQETHSFTMYHSNCLNTKINICFSTTINTYNFGGSTKPFTNIQCTRHCLGHTAQKRSGCTRLNERLEVSAILQGNKKSSALLIISNQQTPVQREYGQQYICS